MARAGLYAQDSGGSSSQWEKVFEQASCKGVKTQLPLRLRLSNDL